jgi:alkylation response protein AidB-like acyl-CoA dehydrogenase
MIADSKSNLDAARLLTLSCAAAIDEHGPNKARDKIASIKVSVPELAHGVIDNAVQVSTRYRYRYTYRRTHTHIYIYIYIFLERVSNQTTSFVFFVTQFQCMLFSFSYI